MSRYQLIKSLFSPSMLSGIVVFLATAAIFVVNLWLFINEESALREYFFGPAGVFTALIAAPDTRAAFAGSIFTSQVIYYVLLAAMGVLVFMTVYAVLQSLGHLIDGLSAGIKEQHVSGLTYKERIGEIFGRLTIRLAVFTSWAVYFTAFVTILMPFCSTLLQAGMQDITAGLIDGWLYLTGGVLMLLASFHLQVIFGRLFFLKPRLFGG